MTKREKKSPISRDELHRMIATRAYFRYVERGYTSGDPEQDWLSAEADVLALVEAGSEPFIKTRKVEAAPRRIAKKGRSQGTTAKPGATRKASATSTRTAKKKTPQTRKSKARK